MGMGNFKGLPYRNWCKERIMEARERFDCLFCGAIPGEYCSARMSGKTNHYDVHSPRWGAEIARAGYYEGDDWT